MEYIGFTSKYYTLWEVIITDKYCDYRYMQNLSMDFEKAKAKRPNACIDLTLRGHSSFRFVIPTFLFGKYKGKQISECTDYDYMKWYHNISNVENVKKVIRPILAENGYKLWNGIYMFNEQEYQYQKMLEEKFPIFEKKIKNNESFSFKCKKYGKNKVLDNGREVKRFEIPFCHMNFNKDVYLPLGKTIVIDNYEVVKNVDPITYEFNIKAYHII